MSTEEYEIETLAEVGDLRVRILQDISPSEPYNDGGSPILRIELDRRWGGWKAEQVTDITSYTVHERIIEAAKRFGPGDELERYLRWFHGVTTVQEYGPNQMTDYHYVSFDPADWREEMGLPRDRTELAAYQAQHGDLSLADMTEWKAFIEGETYGYVIEQRVTWRPVDADRHGYDTRDTWEEVEDGSLWGFYGIDYVQEEARRAFEEELAEHTDLRCTRCERPVVRDEAGTLVDATGGDVCGAEGGNEPHAVQ